MNKHEKLDEKIVETLQKLLGDKYEISMTGTTDPKYYAKHRSYQNGYGMAGLALYIKIDGL